MCSLNYKHTHEELPTVHPVRHKKSKHGTIGADVVHVLARNSQM